MFTPASPPSAVDSVSLSGSSSNSLSITWTRPDCNGDPVVDYVVEGVSHNGNDSFSVATDGPELVCNVGDLDPATAYNVRVKVKKVV